MLVTVCFISVLLQQQCLLIHLMDLLIGSLVIFTWHCLHNCLHRIFSSFILVALFQNMCLHIYLTDFLLGYLDVFSWHCIHECLQSFLSAFILVVLLQKHDLHIHLIGCLFGYLVIFIWHCLHECLQILLYSCLLVALFQHQCPLIRITNCLLSTCVIFTWYFTLFAYTVFSPIYLFFPYSKVSAFSSILLTGHSLHDIGALLFLSSSLCSTATVTLLASFSAIFIGLPLWAALQVLPAFFTGNCFPSPPTSL